MVYSILVANEDEEQKTSDHQSKTFIIFQTFIYIHTRSDHLAVFPWNNNINDEKNGVLGTQIIYSR